MSVVGARQGEQKFDVPPTAIAQFASSSKKDSTVGKIRPRHCEYQSRTPTTPPRNQNMRRLSRITVCTLLALAGLGASAAHSEAPPHAAVEAAPVEHVEEATPALDWSHDELVQA